MMPQSHNADYSNGTSSNSGAAGLQAVSPSNCGGGVPSQLPLLASSVHGAPQSLLAAAMHPYLAPGLPAFSYLYPHGGGGFLQANSLLYSPHSVLQHPQQHPQHTQQPVEMQIQGGLSPLPSAHAGSTHAQLNHKLSGYDNMQHFGSLSQNPSRKPKNSVMSKTNLYINGLHESDTDESVRSLVEGIIDPKSCKAMMSHGKCRGSGFIDCANENDAETVIQILRNKQMPGGTRLAVKFAYENEKDDLNVYVRNLPRTSSFNNNNLEDMFKEFGQVVSVKLLQSDNQYTGTGFVRFSAAEEAQLAVDHMNMKKVVLTEEDKPVICKLADKGGRRMNHGLLLSSAANEASHHPHSGGHSDSLYDSLAVVNGTGSQISPEKTQSFTLHSQYGGVQTGNMGPWLAHSSSNSNSTDTLLAQELQSLGLAQTAASYLLPGLMQAPQLYSDDSAIHHHQQQQQQQQLLAQLIWAHQNPSRIMAAYQQQQQQQQQPLLHWPPQHQSNNNNNSHHNNSNNSTNSNSGGPFYNSEPLNYTLNSSSYPPAQQYRHARSSATAASKSPSSTTATVTAINTDNVPPLQNNSNNIDQQAALFNGLTGPPSIDKAKM